VGSPTMSIGKDGPPMATDPHLSPVASATTREQRETACLFIEAGWRRLARASSRRSDPQK
jgi:hypothetical protein